MFTTIIAVTIALGVGYILGRTHGIGRHHDGAMLAWRQACIGMAMLPDNKLLDLVATEVAVS